MRTYVSVQIIIVSQWSFAGNAQVASKRLNEHRRRPCTTTSVIVIRRQLERKADVVETNYRRRPQSADNSSALGNRITTQSREGFAVLLFTVSLSATGLRRTKHQQP